MSWVNLNDVYVNKTGGTISGNLAVNGSLTINDGTGNDGTYNVANEITTLRDSVSQDIGGTSHSQASGLYLNTYECLAGVCVGFNVSPSASLSAGETLLTVTTARRFISGGQIIIRGVFPNKQPGVFVNYGSDGHTIKVTVEQSISLAIQSTSNFLIPVAWEL